MKNKTNKKKSRRILEIFVLCGIAVLGIALLTRPQKELIRLSDVISVRMAESSVRAEETVISYHAAMELLKNINDFGGHRCPAGRNYPAKDYENVVVIRCEDGIRYELHYWYTNGFSFHPAHPGEDPYASILTRFSAEGTAESAWRLVYDFDASYREWENRYVSH